MQWGKGSFPVDQDVTGLGEWWSGRLFKPLSLFPSSPLTSEGVCEHSAVRLSVCLSGSRRWEVALPLSPHLQPQTGTKCDLNRLRNSPSAPPPLSSCRITTPVSILITSSSSQRRFLPSPSVPAKPQVELEILWWAQKLPQQRKQEIDCSKPQLS